MCGRYGISVEKAQDVYDRYHIQRAAFEVKTRYTIAPGTINPVITRNSPNLLTGMFWGLIPHWAKDRSISFKTINARCEGIEKKPTYRDPLHKHRCLVPASGFYEWNKEVQPSVPYWFFVKKRPLISFAGLYDIWKDSKTQKEIQSYTIITTTANDIVNKTHHRMPVILPQNLEEDWIDPEIEDTKKLLEFLVPYPSEHMSGYQVASLNYSLARDSEELIRPIGDLPNQSVLF